ncbi:hypothetical protein CTM58_06975 [Prevotella intermedia]|uniref:Uncharacterized protein n=1 Tax=Prevotella intermedia TaxID=28131 RepID=A0A2M8TV99_PREIN|nr:hypothetical protein CTM58_06975 [Prevotella intermedia]
MGTVITSLPTFTFDKHTASFFRSESPLSISTLPLFRTVFYKQKEGNIRVNIFRKHIYCITISLSMLCKTYCFAFQKRRFCTVKAALLQRKRAAFAMPKRSYHFLRELSLQNKRVSRICLKKQNECCQQN